MRPIGRRTVLKLVAGSVAGGAAWLMLPKALAASRPGYPGAGRTDGGTGATAGDAVLAIAFDHRLHTRLVVRGKPLTPWQPSESLLLADGAVDDFAITGHREQPVADARHGSGHQSIVTGRSGNLEKEVALTFFDGLPGFAVLQTRYRNLGGTAVQVAGWRNAGTAQWQLDRGRLPLMSLQVGHVDARGRATIGEIRNLRAVGRPGGAAVAAGAEAQLLQGSIRQ